MTAKRPRRSRAELKELMIRAGKDVLLGIEPNLGFDELTYKAVFDRLLSDYNQKVTIGSVHERIWNSVTDFQLDVIDALLLDMLTEQPARIFDSASAALGVVDRTTVSGRKHAVAAAIRLSSAFLWDAPDAATSVARAVRVRIFSMDVESPELQRVGETLREIRRTSNETYAELVRTLMKSLDLRVRSNVGDPEAVIREIALLANATRVGLSSDPLPLASQPRELPTGPDGELEEWYPDAIALWTNVRAMFELDGDGLTSDERRL